MPRRIQRKRIKGWRMPEGAIYVGRPTRWGNLYVVGEQEAWIAGAVFHSRTITPELAVTLYRRDIDYKVGAPTSDEIRTQLVGKDLACWCALDAPCHADVLLRLANDGAK